MKPGRDERDQEATVNAKPRNWATNQAARPLPLLYGRHRIGGTFISDLFDTEARPIYQTYGGGWSVETRVIVGYNYYGSFALALCHGPVSKVLEIWANGVRIWDGEVERTDDDPAELETDIGQVVLYWGTPVQSPDGDLDHDIGYRYVCYAVAKEVHFGQSPTPPNLEFVLERHTEGLTLSAHDCDGDAVLPEVVFDLLTSPVYGCGIDDGHLNVASFEAAAEEVIDEDLGVSPAWRQPTTFRQALADLLAYVGGVVHFRDGKLWWKLLRDEVATVSVDEGDLVEEPVIDRASWPEIRNEVRLSYTDRKRDYEANNVTSTDMAAAQALGYFSVEELQRPWVTRMGVAKRLAIAAQQLLGVPGAVVDLRVRSGAGPIRPGDRLDLAYDPLGIAAMPLRVLEVESGDPGNPSLRLRCQEDASRLADASYVPPDETDHDGTDPAPAPCAMRIGWLTSSQKDGYADGLMVAAARPHGLVIGGSIYAAWQTAGDYRLLAQFSNYALEASLNRWKSSGSNWVLDLTIATDHDQSTLEAFKNGGLELYVVTGVRRIETGPPAVDEHQVTPSWGLAVAGGRLELVGTKRWEIEVSTGQFGSQAYGLESPPTPGWHPTAKVFVGRLSDFVLLKTDSLAFERNQGNATGDLGLERFIRVLTRTWGEIQALGDGTEIEFDRDDATMSPNGSYSTDWGAAVAPASW